MLLLQNLKRHVQRKMKSLAGIPLRHFAPSLTRRQWRDRAERAPAVAHKLPGRLVVNLTSFPPRFATLHLTLKTLLLQSVKPDAVVLWLYERDLDALPPDVLALQQEGLTIETCAEDIKSYKKLIPALKRWPDAYHVTADDDIYYRNDWLAELVAGYRQDDKEILCLRGHYMMLDADGMPLPYRYWHPKTEARGPDNRIFFTSGAGTLFPPGSLHADVTDSDRFCQLSPNGDDIWLYWMAVINGCRIRRVGENKKLIVWKGSKGPSLWHLNKQADGGNDQQIANMIQAYGPPPLN